MNPISALSGLEQLAGLFDTKETTSKRQGEGFDALLNLAGDHVQSNPGGNAANSEESLANIVNRISSESFYALIAITDKEGVKQASPAQFAEGVPDTTIADWLNNDGPLPKFINIVSAERNLSPEQRNSLERIAYEYRNANKTPETVQSIANALALAGIA